MRKNLEEEKVLVGDIIVLQEYNMKQKKVLIIIINS